MNALCESPLTFNAILIWRDELNDGKIMLRDVIDLEATYGKEDSGTPSVVFESEEEFETADATEIPEEEFDDEDASYSVSVMEQAIKPQVLDMLDKIAKAYAPLRKLQERRVESAMAGDESTLVTSDTEYLEMRQNVTDLVMSLNLNNAMIDGLVEQLYAINRELISAEGKVMRFADVVKIKRKEFLDAYFGNELDPAWLDNFAVLLGLFKRAKKRQARQKKK
jgi:RNA polymerase primary sigma factor